MSNRHPSDYFAVWDPTMTCLNASRDKTYWPVGGPLVSASARRCCGFSQPIDFRLNHGIRLENWHWCKRSGVFLSWGTALTRSLSGKAVLWSTLVGIYIHYMPRNRHTVCALLCYVVIETLSKLSISLRVTSLAQGQSWWRHQMETFSALLAICAGNSPVPAQRPVTRSFDFFLWSAPE